MPLNPDSGFDRVASFYDPLAKLVFGSSLQNAQRCLLPFIPSGATILIIGGGSGWLLQQVLEHTSPERIVYLEASEKMLQLAQQQIPAPTIVEFRHGTDSDLHPHERFDIIITPFLLDLFPDERLSRLMQRLYSVLNPGGLWLFADFWPVQQKPLLWQKLLAKSMYLFFGLLSDVQGRKLPDYSRHFDELKLNEQQCAGFYNGFVQSRVYRKCI
ncbi:methyltransferase domain-containing protein [Pontibacter sp. BT310]|uniref:Class I SAM-dependent methyltransferase n=1 Tax=Pontibacter populi TaxID=890055 RepID=A0ABS6X753_9BACT|nr:MULTISPECIES: class I SAM-dependent methyltransferase [Pontibacter]MBJ6116965.1 methyltransferase domain-containing protein [Pontibacter sp. BT310]MBR0569389.1 methyltransferase domain-containing protein [Microvirga sp. STS03]MBW3363818.1 class I SAM-dependent methyltransferase [Pontibacter populi]